MAFNIFKKKILSEPYTKPIIYYSVDKKKYITEKRAIAICYNSVLKRKKLKIFKFNCKKTARLSPKKGTRKIFVEKLGI